ncbi:protein of unknown function [Paraburkholderia kururiensis]
MEIQNVRPYNAPHTGHAMPSAHSKKETVGRELPASRPEIGDKPAMSITATHAAQFPPPDGTSVVRTLFRSSGQRAR